MLVQSVEERQPQHEKGDDVLALDRHGLGQHVAAMLRGIEIDACGITVEQGAGRLGEVGLVPLRDIGPDAEQMDEVIALRRLDSVDIGQPSAGREHGALERRKIVLGMREGEAEGDVGIALSGDVRDPVAVADDLGVVFGGGFDGGVARRTRPGVFDAPQRS